MNRLHPPAHLARPAAATLAAVSLALASPAAANLELAADLYNHNNFAYLLSVSGSTPPQVAQGDLWYGNSYTRVRTVANPGSLDAYLDVTSFPQVQMAMSSGARFRIDDLFLTDGTGIPRSVPVSIRFDVRGTATYATSGHKENSVSINGQLIVTLAGVQMGNTWRPVSGPIENSESSSGVFTGIHEPGILGTFTVGPFQVMTEQNLALEVAIRALSGPYTAWGEMQGVCSFRTTFARGVAAIVLPEGVVAQSAQGAIENSWFVDATVSADAGETDGAGGGGTAGIELAPSVPNPFAGETAIAFTLPAAADVRLDVFDVRGARVATLAAGPRDAGRHVVRWTGTGPDGRRLPRGAYFCALEAGGERRTRRLLLLGASSTSGSH